jgi:NADH:ubiquinone oxidoreductase subunit F (NADH-binding)/NADH:ubiquinone oxidoreductase subunit E/Pyruvate/2-oxoacid:ferredoxin oxidoreductase delta subunit
MKRSGRELLIDELILAQAEEGWLSPSALEAAARDAGISVEEAEGVASFYSGFTFEPRGRHLVSVCVGTACHVKGALEVYQAFCEALGIEEGRSTDADMAFSVEKVACLGCCMLAPAVRVDDEIKAFVGPADVGRIIEEALEGESRAAKLSIHPSSAKGRGQLRLCDCSSCAASGALELARELAAEARALGRGGPDIKRVSCAGASFAAPLLHVIDPRGASFVYGRVDPGQARAILRRHFKPEGLGSAAGLGYILRTLAGSILEGDEGGQGRAVELDNADVLAYLKGQKRFSLEGAGNYSPLDLRGYIECGGMAGLDKALNTGRARIRELIQEAGLRGRGGAGFPTGIKWNAVAEALESARRSDPSAAGYVICNADEGDPGAFMDRMILEAHPFRVLEGMIIAALATGARVGIIYVRAEYPLALERVEAAIAILEEEGYLGPSVIGRGPSFTVETARGAGAFVCGEETALIEALEGRRGMPRRRPPFPSEKGFRGQPSLVNNVETYALVPIILSRGPQDFACLGAAGGSGTKAFALAGKIRRGGLLEVPLGTSLREILEGYGGGTQGGRAMKAVQIGGPSGGCLPASAFDVPIDYESLRDKGAMMGSGGLVALDLDDCMVDIAAFFVDFLAGESCGRCSPCRAGLPALKALLDGLRAGRAGSGVLEDIEALCHDIGAGSLCGFGRNAPNPVLSSLTEFRGEWEAHAAGYCPAGRCRELFAYYVDAEACIGCTRCHQACPHEAIAFVPHEVACIDREKCDRCGLCVRACPRGAIKVGHR